MKDVKRKQGYERERRGNIDSRWENIVQCTECIENLQAKIRRRDATRDTSPRERGSRATLKKNVVVKPA